MDFKGNKDGDQIGLEVECCFGSLRGAGFAGGSVRDGDALMWRSGCVFEVFVGNVADFASRGF